MRNDRFAVLALFSSPILEVCNYLEQTEKYAYRSALSGINLKPEEFDQYYSENRDRIDNFYNMSLVRSLEIIEDLIVTIKFAKI